jgi:threonine dehydrogenase-like Zn-dependent dehydrogenase
MRALTVEVGKAGAVEVEDVAEPDRENGTALVRTVAIGICGTDTEIVQGRYGWPPPGQSRLILGHESVGRIEEAPDGGGLGAGDWVVGIVRRPDPVPCPNCAVGAWDMCRNGQYTEHGIKALNGFAAERYRETPDRLVKVDAKLGILAVLLEPTSVVAKAWEQAERIGSRAQWQPRRVLVTGAGPIGLLAALIGTQRGLEVHVIDRVQKGTKPQLVQALGAHYHTEPPSALHHADGWDLIFECTGAASLLFEVMKAAAPDGIVCLTGVSSGGNLVRVDAGSLNREMVLENNVVFGSVNANRRHYGQAARVLSRADPNWLNQMINRRVPLDDYRAAFVRNESDIKVAMTFA